MATLPKQNISQQYVQPLNKGKNIAIDLDNTLQLDSKINNLFAASENYITDASEIKFSNKFENKFLLASSKDYLLEKIDVDGNLQIFQGTNYSVISPIKDTIKIATNSVIVFNDIMFSSNFNNPILTLSKFAFVQFNNCIFKKGFQTQKEDGCFVKIEDNCKAIFNGCFFTSYQQAGLCVNNLGSFENCIINGGINRSQVPHLNTTIFGELT